MQAWEPAMRAPSICSTEANIGGTRASRAPPAQRPPAAQPRTLMFCRRRLSQRRCARARSHGAHTGRWCRRSQRGGVQGLESRGRSVTCCPIRGRRTHWVGSRATAGRTCARMRVCRCPRRGRRSGGARRPRRARERAGSGSGTTELDEDVLRRRVGMFKDGRGPSAYRRTWWYVSNRRWIITHHGNDAMSTVLQKDRYPLHLHHRVCRLHASIPSSLFLLRFFRHFVS